MTMNGALNPTADVCRQAQRNEGRGRISVYDVLRVKERSLSDCLKRTKVNLDRILDAFIKGKYELISEQ